MVIQSATRRLPPSLVVTTLVIAALLTAPVRAEVINLACTESDMTFMGVSPCDAPCPIIQLSIDTTSGTVQVPQNKLLAQGTFPATVTDATIVWDSELFHYQLNRYTALLQGSADPKHGERMLAVTYDFKCARVQQQF
jgi:hypothetical protein